MIKIEDFKLPITYIEHKLTDEIIKDDLELVKFKHHTKDESSSEEESENSKNSLYKYIFEPDHIFSEYTSNLWCKYYTTDISFLTQTQSLIKHLKPKPIKHEDDTSLNSNYDTTNYNSVYTIFNNITTDNNFLEKYQYIDISYFKQFNNNEHVLQMISVLNITSPLLSVLLPVILFILPLFIFKLYGLNLSITSYLFILKQVLVRHPIGSVFINFKDASLDKKLYLTFTFVFYIFQMIQNAKSCFKFYKNLKHMNEQLSEVKKYIEHTLDTFDYFEKETIKYNKYESFVSNLNHNKTILIEYKNKLDRVCLNNFGIKKIFETGKAMKCFYLLYNHEELKKAMIYSFGFHGFLSNLFTLNKKFKEKRISICKYITNTKQSKTKFKDAYYPVIQSEPIKNSYNLNKKLLITGPNASGKTTMLKTSLLNILFSQQIGMGFYSKAIINPYTYLHSYLNIPDTSSRDSLFQAEARRCKYIIDQLELTLKSKNELHFCIFDELYSGTNPYEAVSSSIALLKYMKKYSNIDYMLTTHFLDVCKSLDNDLSFMNCYMNVIEKEDDFEYTYKLLKGISHVKGGVKVLKDLEYPHKIIVDTKKILNRLN